MEPTVANNRISSDQLGIDRGNMVGLWVRRNVKIEPAVALAIKYFDLN